MEAFTKCSGCGKILYSVEFEQNDRVCLHCGKHHRLGARRRIEITFDPGSFEEHDADVASSDPLCFPQYKEKYESAMAKTGMKEGVLSGVASIDGNEASVAVADFSFMGGSMGNAVGEKIARTLDRACQLRIPCIVFCSSGGARMQEGLFSLMTLPKTTASVHRCRESGIPYISVFTDPTMAGVLASYASIADVILAEPGAMVGFAGMRVSKQAGVSKVPDDFQTSEFAFRSGMIDKIVHRKEIRPVLSVLLKSLGAKCYAG